MVSLCAGLAGKVARLCLQFALPGVVLAVISGEAHAQTPASLDRWLAAQKDIRTWSADFTQTRSFKTLTQPLTAQGRVWFVAPNRFRWELGHPAQTIAVRQTNQMMVI